MNPDFCKEALEKFCGCDNSEIEAGSLQQPAIWLFGLEHGTYKSKHDENVNTREELDDEDYSIETQLKWPYNQKAFKLLAAMRKEYGVKKYKEFAEDNQPFVKGTPGFFKGNLYPFPCHKFSKWPETAHTDTGFSTKEEYLQWCKEHRLPKIKSWVEEYGPKLFIGVGISNRNEFSLAVFGELVEFGEKEIIVKADRKRIFYYAKGNNRLVVIPHFSGPYGLNSDESLQQVGEFLGEFQNQG